MAWGEREGMCKAKVSAVAGDCPKAREGSLRLAPALQSLDIRCVCRRSRIASLDRPIFPVRPGQVFAEAVGLATLSARSTSDQARAARSAHWPRQDRKHRADQNEPERHSQVVTDGVELAREVLHDRPGNRVITAFFRHCADLIADRQA